jgi:hypothetical protein
VSNEPVTGAPVAGAPVRGAERSIAGGVTAVLLAVAATAGALVGFGMRERAPARFFSAAGQQLRGVPAFVTPDRGFGVAAWLGIVQHLVVVVLWAILFTSLAARLRGIALAGAAAAFATVVFVADGALPGTLRLAAGALSVPQRFVLAVVFAAALAAGMRLAPERMRRVSPSES